MKLIELVTNKARILLNVLGNSKAFTAHNLCRWVSRYSFISCRWSRWSTTNSFCSWFEKGFKHVQMFVCWLDLHLKCQERDTFNSCSLARLASLPSFCGPSSTCRSWWQRHQPFKLALGIFRWSNLFLADSILQVWLSEL